MKTYSAKPGDIEREWFVIDAEGLVLGRLASIVANRLRGKHKAMYTPHMDCGDHIVIVNAEKVALTGRKLTDKTYFRHTGYPGGIKESTAGKMLSGKRPEQVIELAVRRMIPRGPLGNQVMRKLHVYAGAEHVHQAQSPKALDIASMNSKNSTLEAANG
ncbi:MAG: 50S ribosomal protein L13 [Geminicoccaceae bacterium]|nr:50S ribosomal protein L13 [Geminicoccaceae bacterium]MCB2011477.1 50S ribosomal protein L13 [Geminicoccaceae bacterium]